MGFVARIQNPDKIKNGRLLMILYKPRLYQKNLKKDIEFIITRASIFTFYSDGNYDELIAILHTVSCTFSKNIDLLLQQQA